MSRKISNIGVLDLRNATDQSIAEIEKISNVGMVLYSPQTAHLLVKLNIGNLGSSCEVPDDVKLIQGQIQITRQLAQSSTEPSAYLITGQVMIEPDVTEEDIQKSISSLMIVGQLICPKSLTQVVRSKIKSLTGQSIFYRQDGRLVQGKCLIDNAFLKSLEKKIHLTVIGKILMTEDMDVELFKSHIESIELTGKALIREEYGELFNSKIEGPASARIELIPEGYLYRSDPVVLDELSIQHFSDACLYCMSHVFISSEISQQIFENAIKSIRCKSFVVCPKSLYTPVMAVCRDKEPCILVYSGKPLIITDDYELSAEELEFAAQPLALIVAGEVTLDPELTPEMMLEKIETLDNFGEINGTKRQLGALKSKTRINKGEFSTLQEENSEDRSGMSNIGYLKL